MLTVFSDPAPDPGSFALSEGHEMLGFCTAEGEIDLATASALSANIRGAIDDSDVAKVVVDCTNLTFIDSQGFYALVNATAYAIQQDHTLVIRNMSSACTRVIDICDWDNELHLESAA
jgi:anti-anti-sigma factor